MIGKIESCFVEKNMIRGRCQDGITCDVGQAMMLYDTTVRNILVTKKCIFLVNYPGLAFDSSEPNNLK